MTTVTVVAMVAGAALILVALAIFWNTKSFPNGGVIVTVLGLALLTLQYWSSIKIEAGGASVELQRQLNETAAAAEVVAVQAEQAAQAVETTRQQVSNLATLLQDRNIVSAAVLKPIQTGLQAAPHVDLARLRGARTALSRVHMP